MIWTRGKKLFQLSLPQCLFICNMCSNGLHLHSNDKPIPAFLSVSLLCKSSLEIKILTYLNINDKLVLLEECQYHNHRVNWVPQQCLIKIHDTKGIIECQEHHSDQILKGGMSLPLFHVLLYPLFYLKNVHNLYNKLGNQVIRFWPKELNI